MDLSPLSWLPGTHWGSMGIGEVTPDELLTVSNPGRG